MLDEECSADATIECESRVLKVHRFILSSRSAVFKAMLSTPMEESRTNRIVVDDMDCDALKAMVQFMYCGRVCIESMSMAEGLLYGADKYQMSSLKEGVLEYLMSELSPDNALKLLQIADLYDETAKKKIVKFICDHFQQLKTTEEWKELKRANPVLSLEVVSFLTDS